ncbi:response regulator [Rhizobium helianthi]|uniref:histidine kinase n=1 Tax=Rhizobium helianthi TaxID=1132695 RepID=A0ABW4M6F6_9HYPH
MDLTSDGALLQRACQRIGDLAVPACIKDGGLRYVVVNAAYARLHGLEAERFPGKRADEIDGLREHDLFRDKQNRALVFGTDESVELRDERGRLLHDIRIERFISQDDDPYLFVLFEPHAIDMEAQARAEFDFRSFGPVLDLLDTGIGIFDANDRLIHYNDRLTAHYAAFGATLYPGKALSDLVKQAYGNAPADMASTAPPDGVWVDAAEERMKIFQQPIWHAVEPMPDGRWVRSVNKRLDNGWLMMLRQDVTNEKIQEMRIGKEVEEAQIFRAAFEELPVAVFLRDNQLRLTYANAAYGAMHSKPREEYLGLTAADMFPEHGECYSAQSQQLIEHGGYIEAEDDVLMPDGSRMSAIVRIRRISSPAGERYLVGSITDVSLVRAAQREAERLHEELKAILQALPVGVAIMDRDLRLEYVNWTLNEFWRAEGEEHRDWTGELYEDFLRFNLGRGVYGDTSFDELLKQRLELLLQPGEIPHFELANLAGRRILVDRSHVGNGKILFTCVDITGIRKREQEVQEARAALDRHAALMQTATSAMSQGLMIMQGEEIAFCNDAVADLLELPADILQNGQPWRAVLDALANRGDIRNPEKVLAEGEAWRVSDTQEPARFMAYVGGARFVDVEVKKSGDEQFLAVFTDVTDARQRELELQRLLERAKAADKAKSEFLANMSHEIRTPMNGVLGMAELLSKSSLDTKQKTFTEIIVKSGKALMTIINDILDFSKIDAGQMTLRKVAFDPGDAIEDVATLLSSSAAEKDIELIVRVAGPSPRVVGDAGRFRQIVTNLLGNSIKFTETGHILIELSVQEKPEGKAEVTLRVTDTGIGIPADQLERIFDKFSQVDGSSTRRHEGTGLGLAITAGLVEIFGGTIDVSSQSGKGSVFTVVLPFEKVSDQQISVSAPSSLRNAKVLVIDDNYVNREILSEQLFLWGFDGVAAKDGPEGLAVLRAAAQLGVKVDAVILDYQMPQMNGHAVATAIRNDPQLRDVPIIFLTSMDTTSGEGAAEHLDIQAHLMKPVRGQLLRKALVEVIRNARREQRGLEEMPVAPRAPISRPAKTVHAVPEAEQPPSALDILVAEDNEVNQIVFTQILQSLDVSFRIVENGAAAVAAWQQQQPRLILMDVSMPVMNGHKATRRIRELERSFGGHVPIVGVTAHALESDRDLCFAAGMDDYLSKPISPELLAGKIREWLPLRRSSGQSLL